MRKRSLRRISVIFAAAVAAVLAVTVGAMAATARSHDEVTINLLDRSTDPNHDAYIKWLVDTFNAQHKGSIKVNLNTIPDNDYHQKIILVLKGSNPPDVFYSWEGGWAQTMMQNGFSAPLDAYYKKYGWSNTMIPAATKLATFSGHKWFVPYFMSASVVWYNPTIFAKYHLTPPKTWTQLVHISDVLKQNGVPPFMLANQQQWEAQFDWTGYFNNKYGTKAYQDLLIRKIPWTDPRVVATFQQLKTMNDDGWFMKGVNSVDLGAAGIPLWKRGKAAMMYQGSFVLSRFLTNGKLNFPINWFPYPQIGGTTPSISMFAENTWMINKKSQHKDQAAELLNFLISKQAQTKMVTTQGPFPANKSVGVGSLPPMVQRLEKTLREYNGYTWMHVDHALNQGVATPFLQELQGVLAGSVTPEKAAQVTEQAATKAMGSVKQ